MNKNAYLKEHGKIDFSGHKMEWTMRRSKGESFFGIKGSRIFELHLKKDGEVTLEYERGYLKKPEDEETKSFLNYLIDKYGKEKKKEKKR